MSNVTGDSTNSVNAGDSSGRRSERNALTAILVCCLVYLLLVLIPSCVRPRELSVRRADPRSNDLRIDVNKAVWAELVQLPGVGPKLADRILADRAKNGSFRGIDDLERVVGIGPKTIQQIEPYLTWESGDLGSP